jgi:ABC-type amino acid transport substrate-binding protein
MKTWIAFFIVECKRTWKTLLKSIGSFCACLLLTAVLVAAFSAIMQNAQVFQKVNIGIAIPEGESISRLATQYISSMDSVRSVCDFYYLDEQEAVEQLKQGTLQAVVVLPEGFYHDVQVGINPPAQIYFPKDAVQNTQVFEELVTAGVSFLQTAEAGVYAALDTASYYGIELQGAGLGDTIAYLFVNQMLKRDSVYSARMLSSMGNLSVAEYYYAAGLVILLMMCGIQFGFLYGKRNRSVEDKLKICGVGSIRQSVVKILVMTEFLYVTGLLYYFAGIGIAIRTGTYFVLYQGKIWYVLLLLCLGIAIYFQVLYELSGSSSQAAVFVFAVNVITIIGAGVLIPEAYLGKEVAGISRFLPMKYWNVYAAGMLEGEISKDSVAGTVFFLLMGMAVGGFLSWRNEKSGQQSHNDIRSCMHAHTGICKNIKKVPMGFVYYKLQLKLWLKHRICWLQILFLVLLLLVIGGIHIPDAKNSRIGLTGVTSGITQTIADRLLQKSDVYQFTTYEDTEELEQAVEAGELECGFVFAEDFEKQYEKGSFADSITYVYTPFTTKGMAVRETIYGTVLELYGEKLLQQNQETIVGQSSEEASTMLAERYEYYLNSDAIFHTEVIHVETDAGMGSDLRRAEPGSDGQKGDADRLEIGKPNHNQNHNQNSNQNSNQNHNQNSNQNRNHNRIAGQPADMENLIRGVISCMIFLTVYLSGASCKEEKNQHFLSILEKGKRHSYECAGMLAAVTPMMLVGTGLSCLTILQSEMLDAASGAGFVTATEIGMVIVTEILQMLLLIVVSILFTACTMCIWKKDMGMLSALPVLILLQIIICPVIFDMAVYVPAVKYIRYLCPIAYYL